MHDRPVLMLLVALTLSIPWLIAGIGPDPFPPHLVPTLLADVALAAGLLWAGHQRRVLLGGDQSPLRPHQAAFWPVIVAVAGPAPSPCPAARTWIRTT